MVEVNRAFTSSTARSAADASAVHFGVDVNQASVFLDVDVVPSHSFARIMLALGRVVRMQDTGGERDHSAYQEWVRGEYLKELPAHTAAAQIQLPGLIEQRRLSEERAESAQGVVSTFLRRDPLWQQRRQFWKWLYTHNLDAWVVLDPIVSVQPDATFFEAFSLDESTYARVTLPHEATTSEREPVCGTTNIDFSRDLEREFARTRPYRPLRLGVGAESVTLETKVSSLVEKKIDLPESWVRGLVEVQAALALAPVTINIDASALADVLARLDAERERHGPRSLIFALDPGQPIRMTIEPWGEVFVSHGEPYGGETSRRIKVWGRRRLRILRELLPLTSQVTVRLIDSGMPSFWSIQLDGIDLTIGLSGWTSQDWAGKARFSAITPASAAEDSALVALRDDLRDQLVMTPDTVTERHNVSPMEARVLLQRLCVAGSAMFDPTDGSYRWRALFPDIDLQSDSGAGLEERRGVELFRRQVVELTDDYFEGESRVVKSRVTGDDRSNITSIVRDEDGRVVYAQCDCSHFRYHKLRQGPCRHIVATSLAGS